MTVTTGGRVRICAGSDSSSSSRSPSRERTSTSRWSGSATSWAAVGSSTSLTVAMTPSSSSALITSVDFRRIPAASSPTVTDSGSLISSRLISCGGSGGGGIGSDPSRAGAAGSAGAATAAAARPGRGRGAAGRGGARGGARGRAPAARAPGGGRAGRGRAHRARVGGLRLGGQLAAAPELDPQLVGLRGEERAHGPHALVAHALERHDQVLAGDAQLLRQVDDLYPCRHARLPPLPAREPARENDYRTLLRRPARPLERPGQSARLQRLLHAFDGRAHPRASPPRDPLTIHSCLARLVPYPPDQLRLPPHFPARHSRP